MAIAVYFGKVNLISSHMNEVINNTTSFRNILNKVLTSLNDDVSFTYCSSKIVNGQPFVEEIEYSLSVKHKSDTHLQGYILKNSFLHYKEFDKKRKEVIPQKIENTESAEFYYDVFREMIGYQRTLRFGYKEFLYAFNGILNTACANHNLNYSFNVQQFTEGFDLDDIRNELQKGGPIKTLKIKYQIPNPDSETLKKIQDDPEKTITDFKSANLSIKEISFRACSDTALNINSDIIEQELQNIDNMHSSINAKKATQNGYIVVETINTHGIKRSSTDSRPVIKHIDTIYELENEAATTITNYVRQSITE